MKRALLVAAVAALAIVGWLWFRKGSPDAPAPAPGSAAGSGEPIAGTPTVTPAPSLPGSSGAPRLPEPGAGSDYVVGDVRVRDHRGGSNAPMDVPPNIHAPNTRELPPALTQDIAQKVRTVLADCAKDVPKDARGPHPRLEGQIVVSIKDHKLSVTGATMQLRDMPVDTVDATKQCVETHSVGLETAASDQDDLDNYSIGVTFAVL